MKEILRKFRYLHEFSQYSHQVVTYEYLGTEKGNRASSLRNIVLRSDGPFCVLVGFELKIPILRHIGYDPYGFVCSDHNGVVVIRTYLGKKPIKFKFLVNRELQKIPISISSTDEDQNLPFSEHGLFKPHWWQRLGFYA